MKEYTQRYFWVDLQKEKKEMPDQAGKIISTPCYKEYKQILKG
jgi:hypothetical protein